MNTCSICPEKHYAHGYCRTHMYSECRELIRTQRHKSYQKRKTAILADLKARYYAVDPAIRKERSRRNVLKRRYGLTVQQYEDMLRAQNNRCKICREEFTEQPCIDHRHDETKRVRGLLCLGCNSAIGMLREKPENFFAAFNYLEDDRLGIDRG